MNGRGTALLPRLDGENVELRERGNRDGKSAKPITGEKQSCLENETSRFPSALRRQPVGVKLHSIQDISVFTVRRETLATGAVRFRTLIANLATYTS